jgi:hypothetical protein
MTVDLVFRARAPSGDGLSVLSVLSVFFEDPEMDLVLRARIGRLQIGFRRQLDTGSDSHTSTGLRETHGHRMFEPVCFCTSIWFSVHARQLETGSRLSVFSGPGNQLEDPELD